MRSAVNRVDIAYNAVYPVVYYHAPAAELDDYHQALPATATKVIQIPVQLFVMLRTGYCVSMFRYSVQQCVFCMDRMWNVVLLESIRKCHHKFPGCHLDGVLATGTKGRGFKPGRDDGFLRAIKIRSTPSFGWEVKPETPRKILRHVKDPLTYLRNWYAKFSLLHLPPTRSQMSVPVGKLWWTS
jgi:hypothetical protein